MCDTSNHMGYMVTVSYIILYPFYSIRFFCLVLNCLVLDGINQTHPSLRSTFSGTREKEKPRTKRERETCGEDKSTLTQKSMLLPPAVVSSIRWLCCAVQYFFCWCRPCPVPRLYLYLSRSWFHAIHRRGCDGAPSLSLSVWIHILILSIIHHPPSSF